MSKAAIPVLIVGGGLVGLSAAVFLAARNVSTVLVERRAGSSPHPRAIGFTPRTMELYRAAGLGPSIPQIPPGFRLRRARVESLAGTWLEEEGPWTPKNEPLPEIEYSPCAGAAIAQDRLEPLLRDKARELGADIRLETELVSFEQDADGVTAILRAGGGNDYALRADYVVAADGHRSPVREALGIGRDGRGHIRTMRSVLFRAPLEPYLKKGVMQFQIDQPDFKAFLSTYGDGRWLLMLGDDEERDADTLKLLIVRAIGRPDLPVEIIATGRWELSALIADRFASGRIFIAGDAAHTLPPNRGGYGANTGIEDAHNLAWKLAAVLAGESNPRLLDSYDAERRPIAWLRHQQIFARPDYKAVAGTVATDTPIIGDEAMEFGQLYRSTAVLGAGDDLPAALRPDLWAGQPGTRAPHLWVTAAEPRVSTLDLLQHGWVLIADDEAWCSAALQAGAALGIAVKCLRPGLGALPLNPQALHTALGFDTAGACLIRPDGYIAWRTLALPASPLGVLTEALAAVASAVRPAAIRASL
jgi:2-polyprenyl-6-methoxyphenol hydroxylase-like FAD-dependent oxidoreductase